MSNGWINKYLFNKRKTTTENPPVIIPEDIVNLLKKLQAYPLSNFIDWVCHQSNSNEIFEALCFRARELFWNEPDITKLETYFDYFSKNYKKAYAKCYPFVNAIDIDLDYFGIACMALYNTNQFELAFDLLKRIKSKEHHLIGNIDFLISSTLICWSMGDRYRAGKYIDTLMTASVKEDLAIFNAIAICFEIGDMDGVKRAKSYIVESASQHPNFRYCFAFIELANNNYQEGLYLAESRYEMSEAHRYMRSELFSKPRWNKESISNKTLLIHGEQGLGDMIQTARYFNDCLVSAKNVVIECPHESIALLQHNFPTASFVPLSDKPLEQHFDIWVGTLSLPYIFNTTCATIPGRQGYLNIPEDHRTYWKNRVEELGTKNRVKIGIAWSGYPGHRADRRRSIKWSLIQDLIKQYPSVDFYAVQTKVPDNLPDNLHNCTEEMITLSDTAALIEQMDLIISVDTSIVHLAGAIGKETWMMLPYRYEWRWGLEGEDSNWYDSVKVIRQPSPGAWAPVLSRVFGKRLKDFLFKERRQ